MPLQSATPATADDLTLLLPLVFPEAPAGDQGTPHSRSVSTEFTPISIFPFVSFTNVPSDKVPGLTHWCTIFAKASAAFLQDAVPPVDLKENRLLAFEQGAARFRENYLALGALLGVRSPLFDFAAAELKFSPASITDLLRPLVILTKVLRFGFEPVTYMNADDILGKARDLDQEWGSCWRNSEILLYASRQTGELAPDILENKDLVGGLQASVIRWNLRALDGWTPAGTGSAPADGPQQPDTQCHSPLADLADMMRSGNFAAPDFPMKYFRKRLLAAAVDRPRPEAKQWIRLALHATDSQIADLIDD